MQAGEVGPLTPSLSLRERGRARARGPRLARGTGDRLAGRSLPAIPRRRFSSSAPAMSGARSCWRSRRCPSPCAGSTHGTTPFRRTSRRTQRPTRADDPAAAVAAAPSGAFVLVMTHDHALDLAVTAAALRRADLPFVGLIGSATKRARFERRFREIGLGPARIAALACPIGLPGIAGKEPAVIAASVAAQLLVERTRLRRAAPTRFDEAASA